jgi:glycosyltransferase EpsF
MIRVLHLLRRLEPGGIELWLERLISRWKEHGGDPRVQFHIALEEPEPGSLAGRFREIGARLHHCPPPRRAVRSASGLVSVLADAGPFQAVHCHNHHASGFFLGVAAQMGIRMRIAHAHADFRLAAQRPLRRVYAGVARRVVWNLANVRVAVSEGAALDLFGTAAKGVQILPCGVNLEEFFREGDCGPLAGPRFKLAHVGRLVPEKNHAFLFRLLKELLTVAPASELVLAGDGPMRAELELEALRLGVADRVRFLGERADVPSILSDADAFVFPSVSEGLGLAAVEAQAAGVPALIAEHLPGELTVVENRVKRLALDVPIGNWVEALREMKAWKRLDVRERRRIFSESPFSMEKNIHAWSKIYASQTV